MNRGAKSPERSLRMNINDDNIQSVDKIQFCYVPKSDRSLRIGASARAKQKREQISRSRKKNGHDAVGQYMYTWLGRFIKERIIL